MIKSEAKDFCNSWDSTFIGQLCSQFRWWGEQKTMGEGRLSAISAALVLGLCLAVTNADIIEVNAASKVLNTTAKTQQISDDQLKFLLQQPSAVKDVGYAYLHPHEALQKALIYSFSDYSSAYNTEKLMKFESRNLVSSLLLLQQPAGNEAVNKDLSSTCAVQLRSLLDSLTLSSPNPDDLWAAKSK